MGVAALLLGCSSADAMPPLLERLDTALATHDAAQFAIEDSVAACMRDLGFVYAPVIERLRVLQSVARPEPFEVTAFLSNRSSWPDGGYGLANMYLKGWYQEADSRDIIEQSDEYIFALYGGPDDPDGSGCRDEAYLESQPTQDALALADEVADTEAKAASLLRADPLMTKWEACMASRGYPVLGPFGVRDLLLDEFEATFVAVFGETDSGSTDVDLAQLQYSRESQEFHSEDARMAELIRHVYEIETAMATADLICGDQGYYERAQEILAAAGLP